MAYSITYSYSVAEEVTAVKINGTAATSRTSADDVESNPGSFFWDSLDGTLYVSASSGSVIGKAVVAVCKVNVATELKTFNDDHYTPRISRVPTLSMRVEKVFGGVGQISIGSLDIANADGEFDASLDWLWDNADTKITLKLGYDDRVDVMAYGNYVALGSWAVDKWRVTDSLLMLDLKEQKNRLDIEVPLERFSRDDYSVLDESFVGKPIPRAYGRVYGARGVLLDESTRTFKVANHAILAIDAVRVRTDDTWATVTPASTTLASGEFTLEAADWETDEEVEVDFRGMKTAGGDLMENPADVVKDLLEYIGIASGDISFTDAEARDRFDIGTNVSGDPVTVRAISLNLAEVESLVDVLGRINAAAGSLLVVNASGQFTFKAFWPEVSDGLPAFTQEDCASFAPEVDATDLASKVSARYAHRRTSDWWQLEVIERTENQYEHNVVAAQVIDVELAEVPLERDAEYIAERKLVSENAPRTFYKVTLPARGLSLLPGDQIRVANDRRGFDEVLDVVQITLDIGKGAAALLCSNLRGWGSTSGFIASSGTISFPADLGGGTITAWDSTWSAAQKAWAKANLGFYTEVSGLADASDPDSLHSTYF